MRLPLRFRDGGKRETELADSTTRTIRLAEVERGERGEARVVYTGLGGVRQEPAGAAILEEAPEGG